MAWTVAVIIALLGVSSILLFLNKSFDKSKQGIKVLLTMLCLGSLIIVAQVSGLIIRDKASSTTLTNLTKLSNANLIICIVIFSFFLMYFIVTYLVGTFRAVRDAKKEKEDFAWDEV